MLETLTEPERADAQQDEMGGQDWSARIQAILNQRKPYLDRLPQLRSGLDSLSERLQRLRSRVNEARSAVRGRVADSAFEGLQTGELDSLIVRAGQQLEALSKLEKRLKRQTLNVAVIGNARQGKSLLLRNLSGLSPQVIPDRSGGQPCTGARSKVLYREGKTSAKVEFHTEASLLSILHEYWQELGLPSTPPSIDSFLKAKLPAPPPALEGKALKEELYRALQTYHQRLGPFVQHLGNTMNVEQEDEIARYVTQPAPDQVGLSSYAFLAVREVEIYCQFPHGKVSGLGLIDLPGLGEATLGGPRRVVETLEIEADVALFVWRPDQNDFISAGHLNLYDTCARALRDQLAFERWCFLVLNEVNTSTLKNREDCESLLRSYESINRFFGREICDCSKQVEVETKVLGPVLAYLTQGIAVLDRDFARSCSRDLRILQSDVSRIVADLRDHLGAGDQNLEESQFLEHFDKVWESLRVELTKLSIDLSRQTEKIDERFSALVKEVLADCESKSLVPVPDEAVRALLREGGHYPEAFGPFCNEIRADLSCRLRKLDDGLEDSLDKVKQKIADVFVEHGRFQRLLLNGDRSLAAVAAEIPAEHRRLKSAFEYLRMFQMSARGVIGYTIRQALRSLQPAALPLPESGRTTTEHMVEELQKAVAKTLQTLRENLVEQEYRRPNECAYSLFMDFWDSVVYARGMVNDWSIFYRERRTEIWPDVFRDLEQVRTLREELRKLVEFVEASNPTEFTATLV